MAEKPYDVVRRGGRTNLPSDDIIHWADVEIADEEFGTVVLRVEAYSSSSLDEAIPKAVAQYWRDRDA